MTTGAPFVHDTADVDHRAVLGEGTMVWNWTKVREGARIGARCRIGQNVYIDHDVEIGDGCKIQNGASVFHGVTLGRSVFVGPGATFTNDRVPRAASGDAWSVVPTVVEDNASIGANATVLCGIRLGEGCMVAAGAVVIRDVAPYTLVVGNPGRVVGFVDIEGNRADAAPDGRPVTGT